MVRFRGMTPATFAEAYLAGRRRLAQPKHVFLCVADHFEPDWRGASMDVQRERVKRWTERYIPSTHDLGDSRGRPPQHTFFYPVEVYQPEFVEAIAGLARRGHGDVEVHLHHDNDNSAALEELLTGSIEKLHEKHGLLSKDESGRLRYGFIHGNWALDNSRPDGRHCGVNDELTVLIDTGCYADFTMPAAPSPAQTRTINSIYYATDNPHKPKSHDRGVAASRLRSRPPNTLLLIQGPLLVRHSRPWRRPRVENGNLAGSQPPTAARLDDWLRARVTVEGHDSWQFIKLHTHGAQERNSDVLLGPSMRRFHEQLRQTADRRGFAYYYVTAREMAQLVNQAERGYASPDFDNLDWYFSDV